MGVGTYHQQREGFIQFIVCLFWHTGCLEGHWFHKEEKEDKKKLLWAVVVWATTPSLAQRLGNAWLGVTIKRTIKDETRKKNVET